ncbi:unnamed protein product [Pelagomonas calceolata]|uniref:Uncharacterized protein n=1 Tax=Pelagomonas calceolata TaxID=35677 RepID=A0A8J2WXA8_9STRA|nr:unnamed protein product [Pelagomonas calceolata]
MSIGLDAIPLDVLRGVVAFATGRFTVGRLDGGVKVCGPEFQAWSGHEERQTTARDLRALVSAIGFHQLRCVSRSWRSIADDHLRGTHERIFGVRPLDILPVDGRVAREPSSWLGRLRRLVGRASPDGDDDEYLFSEPPSEALTVPWNLARYDAGTGDLDGSAPVLAAVRRARACLAWRTSLTSYARFGCCGHDTRFRESLAWTGFFGNAAGLPWRLDAHHVYIDREAETAFEREGDLTRDAPDPPFSFNADHEHVTALKAFAVALLPTNVQASASSGETTRVDLVGGPTHFMHKYDEATRSTEAVLFDTEVEYKDAYACCPEAPSTVVPGACLFSFRADPSDVCTPEQWGEWHNYDDREFGTLRRRGGRAWRVAGCAAPGPVMNNADVVLDEVLFEKPDDSAYTACEACFEQDGFDYYAATSTRPAPAGVTVRLVFRVLKHEAGGRLASEISRSRDRYSADTTSSAWSPYRLVMSGTVRGLPILTPVREPASEAEELAERERLREWKAADKELQAQLPPCEQYDIMHAEKYLRDGTWPTPLNPIYKDRKTDPWWSEPQCECERCQFEADRGRDKEFVRLSYYCTSYGLDIPIYRLGLACDKVLAQLPLNKHGRNPSNYGETKVH